MQRFGGALMVVLFLAGCASTGGSNTVMAPNPSRTVENKTAQLVQTAKRSMFPTAEEYNEAGDMEGHGRPLEPEHLNVVQKRYLYAQRVMAECVKAAPHFEEGLKQSALEPSGQRANGSQSYSDRTFRVAASSTSRACDVRALGGKLEDFADSMQAAFDTEGQLLRWSPQGQAWRGEIVIKGQRYHVSATENRVQAGSVMVATLSKG